eukprot:221150_1
MGSKPSTQRLNQSSMLNEIYLKTHRKTNFDEWIQNELPLSMDIICVCIDFIGFLMNSSICDASQCLTLYNLMCIDHKRRNICSPLTQKYHISYFELLFRISGDFTNSFMSYLLSYCIGMKDLLIVFQTEFGHIFVFYTHTDIQRQSNGYTTVDPLDSSLYLIESKFNYKCTQNRHLMKKTCPRTIDIVCDVFRGEALEIATKDTIFLADFCMFFRDLDQKVSYNSCTMADFGGIQYDIVGNEVVGGHEFDSGYDWDVNFKQIEVFHIL